MNKLHSCIKERLPSAEQEIVILKCNCELQNVFRDMLWPCEPFLRDIISQLWVNNLKNL